MSSVPQDPEPGESIAEFRLRQKQAAIRLAIQARQRVKLMRDAIRKGQIDDLELLRGNRTDLEPLIGRWPIDRLLKLCVGIGQVRCLEILAHAQMRPTVKVERLTYAQRAELARFVHQARDPMGSILDDQR